MLIGSLTDSSSVRTKNNITTLGFLSCLTLAPIEGFEDDINNEEDGIVVDNTYKTDINNDNKNKSMYIRLLQLLLQTECNSPNAEFLGLHLQDQ